MDTTVGELLARSENVLRSLSHTGGGRPWGWGAWLARTSRVLVVEVTEVVPLAVHSDDRGRHGCVVEGEAKAT